MRLHLMKAMVAAVLALPFMSFMPAASAPCIAGTIAMEVGSAADLQNMAGTMNCTGKGTFHVTWIGSLQLAERMELSGNKELTITGSTPLSTVLPEAVIDAGKTTGIISVSDGSTLNLVSLVLKGGSSENGGAVDVSSFSSVYVADCFLTSNTASTGGETIYSALAIAQKWATPSSAVFLSCNLARCLCLRLHHFLFDQTTPCHRSGSTAILRYSCQWSSLESGENRPNGLHDSAPQAISTNYTSANTIYTVKCFVYLYRFMIPYCAQSHTL